MIESGQHYNTVFEKINPDRGIKIYLAKDWMQFCDRDEKAAQLSQSVSAAVKQHCVKEYARVKIFLPKPDGIQFPKSLRIQVVELLAPVGTNNLTSTELLYAYRLLLRASFEWYQTHRGNDTDNKDQNQRERNKTVRNPFCNFSGLLFVG